MTPIDLTDDEHHMVRMLPSMVETCRDESNDLDQLIAKRHGVRVKATKTSAFLRRGADWIKVPLELLAAEASS